MLSDYSLGADRRTMLDVISCSFLVRFGGSPEWLEGKEACLISATADLQWTDQRRGEVSGISRACATNGDSLARVVTA